MRFHFSKPAATLWFSVFSFCAPAAPLAAAPAAVPATAAPAPGNPLLVQLDKKANMAVWLESSLKRVFPHSPAGSTNLSLLTARNARIAFQVCIQNRGTSYPKVQCTVVAPEDLKVQVRRVGFVPFPHFALNTDPSELDGIGFLPGFVPDPLYPEDSTKVASQESQSFWITVNIPAEARAGIRELNVRLSINDGKQNCELPVRLEASPLVLQPRKNFHVIHWWRGEATWDYYHTGMFDERWWRLTRDQLKDMLDHGSDVAFVPVFFERRETFKRPCQLLDINEPAPGTYEFDWARVKQFTDMARAIGFKHFEWPHMWIYWGVENPMRLYKKVDGNYVMLWPPDISGFSDTYVNFLKQFLPAFHQFLTREGLLETSCFHLSDEPGGGKHLENYRRARQILRDLAPWMKVMDALSDIRYGKEGVTDIPVPIVSSAQAYIDAKIPHWVYFCCGPRGPWLNRFMDTPLPKIRMSGWLFYRLKAEGFLHWGFNYWHKMEREEIGDPFTDASNADWPGIPYGDPFMIYPGKDGPIDSLRWEVFAESLQDYAILQTAGIKPDDPLLGAIRTYADFPKQEAWINQALERILKPAKERP